MDPQTGKHLQTEGHPSPYKNSLSLYYYIRYNLADSDRFGLDNYTLAKFSPVIENDYILRVTDHPFTATGDATTNKIDHDKLNELDEQVGSEPMHKFADRREVVITDKVKKDYQAGLAEIKPATLGVIKDWRRALYDVLRKENQ